MEEENAAIRLKVFMDYVQLSNSQFADMCGIPRPTLSQLLNGRNKKISDILIKQIHDKFPKLSILWLLFGEGEMMQPDSNTEEHRCENLNFVDNQSMSGEYAKDNRVNSSLNNIQSAHYRDVSSVIKPVVLSAQLGQNGENAKKVTKIMVFYDDNSFDTFVPGKF